MLLGNEHASSDKKFWLGKVVEQSFFRGNHLKFEVHRGPFSRGEQWLHTCLSLHLQAADDSVAVIPDSDADSDSDDEPDPYRSPEATKAQVQRLIKVLLKIVPADEPQTFVLHHHDLHGKNIFVNSDHELSGVIDWECLLTAPLWVACEIPKFLQTKLNRNLCPDPDGYMKEVLNDGSEELNPLYYRHLEEYVKTQLRAFFLEEMQRACPEWIDVWQNNKMEGAFAEAVAVPEDKSNCKIIDEWLDAVEEHGSAPCLGDMLHAYEQELLDNHPASSKAAKDKDGKSAEQ